MESNILSTQKITVGFFVALLALSPLATFAQQETASNPNAATRDDTHFCEHIDAVEAELKERMQARADEALEKFEARMDEYQALKAERLQELADNRAEADADWSELIANLLDKTQTPEQEAAINEFESAVEDLLTVRRSAVDEALETFEDAAAAVRDERRDVFSTLIDELLAEIQVAFDEAHAACEDGEEPKEVRVALRADLEEARKGFTDELQSYDFREEIQALNQVRKETVEAAVEVFKTGLEAAKEELRDALGTEG